MHLKPVSSIHRFPGYQGLPKKTGPRKKMSILGIKHQENVIPTTNRAKTITQLCERKEKQTHQHKTPEAVVHTLQKN